jgi:hypothetical protein
VELADVMRATGQAVYEELVADQLIADLARRFRSAGGTHL